MADRTMLVRTRRRRLIVLAGTLITLLMVSLLSTALFIADDSSNSSYLEIINNHPLIQSVKEYHGYATKKISETYKSIFDDEYNDDNGLGGRENATLFSLVRNDDLEGMISSIEYVETRFNNQFHYDWVFVNDKNFTEEFITKVSAQCSGKTYFETIPHEYWSYPEWIDQEKLAKVREEMKSVVKYGGSASYRHMCRFNSGFFYKMDIMNNYDYYWRVEPDIKFKCDINYDPFKVMRENGKRYGFNMAMLEFEKSIPTLWQTTKEYFHSHPDSVALNNNMKFISDDNGTTFSLCHFWSNFEIGDLSFFRSEKYESFFQALDQNGGFFYERWGDAPVHTIAVSVMLPVDELQYFDNTGYYHVPNQNCPPQSNIRTELNCDCNPQKDFSWHKWSCVSRFFLVNEIPIPKGVHPNHSKRDMFPPDEVFNLQKLLFSDDESGKGRWLDEL